MILATRRAEYDYYQNGRKIGAERFIATPDEVIKVMLEAASGLVSSHLSRRQAKGIEPAAALPARMRRIVTTSQPKPRQRSCCNRAHSEHGRPDQARLDCVVETGKVQHCVPNASTKAFGV